MANQVEDELLRFRFRTVWGSSGCRDDAISDGQAPGPSLLACLHKKRGATLSFEALLISEVKGHSGKLIGGHHRH